MDKNNTIEIAALMAEISGLETEVEGMIVEQSEYQRLKIEFQDDIINKLRAEIGEQYIIIRNLGASNADLATAAIAKNEMDIFKSHVKKWSAEILYFFSYSHSNGFSNITLTLPNEIKGMDDIEKAERIIKGHESQFSGNITILNYKKMDE